MRGRFSTTNPRFYLRMLPTPAERLILQRGLSPWSMVTHCDLCASVPKYLKRHGLTRHTPLVQVGRWMVHEYCQHSELGKNLSTLGLPALDYSPFRSLPPATQLAVMKIALLEESWDHMDRIVGF